jgi:endonuclease/exonuclease/phosphatase family metal-dependent hydrolase
MSWNMGMALPRPRHADAWRWALERADILLLQEAVPPAWMADRHMVFVPKYPAAAWGTAVVSSWPLHAVPAPGPPDQWLSRLPGSAVVADAELPAGTQVRLVSLHPRAEATEPGFTGDVDLTAIKPSYHSTAFPVDLVHAELAGLLAGRRFVAAGDLNSALRFDVVYGRDPRFYGNADLFQKFRDSGWRDCHMKFHAGEERTFFRGDQHFMLDHAYVDDATYDRVVSCEVMPYDEVRLYSDHAPLLMGILA